MLAQIAVASSGAHEPVFQTAGGLRQPRRRQAEGRDSESTYSGGRAAREDGKAVPSGYGAEFAGESMLQAQSGKHCKKKRPSFAGGSWTAQGWGYAHEYAFIDLMQPERMRAHGAHCCQGAEHTYPDNYIAHRPEIRDGAQVAFESCRSRGCDKVTLAHARSPHGNQGSRKPKQ